MAEEPLQIVPTFPDAPFYTMTTVLDGTVYVFAFKYSEREDRWYFNLSLNDGTLLIAGVKVICNIDLLATLASVLKPQGMLIAKGLHIQTETLQGKQAAPPGFGELGSGRRVRLFYIPASRLKTVNEAIEAALVPRTA